MHELSAILRIQTIATLIATYIYDHHIYVSFFTARDMSSAGKRINKMWTIINDYV